MLEDEGVPYRYREYRKEPLSTTELRKLFKQLGVGPKALLRTRDRAFGELGLTGDESDTKLTELMAKHPTLLQRPIGILGDRAVVGRPPANLLELVT